MMNKGTGSALLCTTSDIKIRQGQAKQNIHLFGYFNSHLGTLELFLYHHKKCQERSPGLKILWLWTSVVRNRLRDMESLMNAQQQEPIPSDTLLVDMVLGSEDVVLEDTS